MKASSTVNADAGLPDGVLPWTNERSWHIIASTGEWLGDLSTPDDVTVFSVGEDYLLGRHLDELGVERVVLYALRR